MTIQFRGETLRVTPPRTARFLRRTIPPARTTYVPRDAGLRADHHRPGNAAPYTWPVRLTDCGEHPGVYGDNNTDSNIRRLRDAR